MEGVGVLPMMAYEVRLCPKGVPFLVQVYRRVGISLVEVYERVGKIVILVCKQVEKELKNAFMAVKKSGKLPGLGIFVCKRVRGWTSKQSLSEKKNFVSCS